MILERAKSLDSFPFKSFIIKIFKEYLNIKVRIKII
jgi:hypothetical protein